MFNSKRCIYGDQNVQVPAHLNFGKLLLDTFLQMTDKIALVNVRSGEELTYAQLTQYAVDLSVSLTKLGVQRGDIVAVGTEKRIEFIPTVLAIIFSGATYTPYDTQSGNAVLDHKLAITSPKYFICSKDFWKAYSGIIKKHTCVKTIIFFDDDDNPDSLLTTKSLTGDHKDINKFEPTPVQGQIDTVFILYSSGTTGMPKGVQLTHLNCILNSLPDDFKDESLQTAYICGEWYHNYDTFMTYKFLLMGRKVAFTDAIPGQDILSHIEKYKINIAMLVPALIGPLSKSEDIDKYNIESLKIIYSRSSPLHSKIIQAIKDRFPKLKNVLQGYGMTEAGEPTSESWGTKGPKTGSVGMASPGVTLKIVDPESRKALDANQRGEVCVRGPVLMKGYIGVDPATYLDEEGFLKTGDLGYYDEDKYFYIVDRLKEIIEYEGYKIAPLELETILSLHPGVKEAGVVGKPAEYGEMPTAFIVRQPGSNVTEKELVDYVIAEVPPYMQLKGGVIFISKLPRNPRGKLLRRRLREMLQEIN